MMIIETTLSLLMLLSPFVFHAMRQFKIINFHSYFKLGFISFIFSYAAMLCTVYLAEIRFDKELAAFDLNDDGTFSETEFTPETQEAMNNVILDTGRTFAPFTGLVLVPIYTAIMLSISISIVKFKSYVSGKFT